MNQYFINMNRDIYTQLVGWDGRFCFLLNFNYKIVNLSRQSFNRCIFSTSKTGIYLEEKEKYRRILIKSFWRLSGLIWKIILLLFCSWIVTNTHNPSLGTSKVNGKHPGGFWGIGFGALKQLASSTACPPWAMCNSLHSIKTVSGPTPVLQSILLHVNCSVTWRYKTMHIPKHFLGRSCNVKEWTFYRDGNYFHMTTYWITAKIAFLTLNKHFHESMKSNTAVKGTALLNMFNMETFWNTFLIIPSCKKAEAITIFLIGSRQNMEPLNILTEPKG